MTDAELDLCLRLQAVAKSRSSLRPDLTDLIKEALAALKAAYRDRDRVEDELTRRMVEELYLSSPKGWMEHVKLERKA